MNLDPCERCSEIDYFYFIGWTYGYPDPIKWDSEKRWLPVIKCENCYLERDEVGLDVSSIRDGRDHFAVNKLGHEVSRERGGPPMN